MSRPIWLLTLMLLATALPTRGQAHAGHDDAPGTGSAAIASRHVLTALSDRFEVVLKHDPLRPGLKTALDLYLSDFKTNAPVAGAAITLSFRSGAKELWKGAATATQRAGVYTAPFQAPADTGSFTVLVTVASAGAEDRFVLSGLDVTRLQSGEGISARRTPGWLWLVGIGLVLLVGVSGGCHDEAQDQRCR